MHTFGFSLAGTMLTAHLENIFFRPTVGSRESAPTNNRKFTSDKRQQAQGKCAVRARVCGRAFAGARLRARVRGRALSPQPLYNLHSWVGSIVTCFHYWKV